MVDTHTPHTATCINAVGWSFRILLFIFYVQFCQHWMYRLPMLTQLIRIHCLITKMNRSQLTRTVLE